MPVAGAMLRCGLPLLSRVGGGGRVLSWPDALLARSWSGQAEQHSPAQDDKPIPVDIPVPFLAHNCDPPPQHTETSGEELFRFFRVMNVMRRMEIASDLLYKQGHIRGFCHLYDGQEAVAVGMEAALTWEDPLITAYREHCNYLGRGATVTQVVAELLGRQAGCSRGKGGSMHMYHLDHHYYGGNGIVGTPPPLGTGLAYALQYLKKPNVAVAMYGDGSANQGQVAEAMNMAALWKLPIVYVVENNHFGMGTSEARASAHHGFYDRVGYIPGIKVDGMSVFAVKVAVAHAKEWCLAGRGPILLEMDTYRYHGHSMSDPGSTYRTRDEIQGVRRERDPIDLVHKLITKEGLATAEELKALAKECRAEVDAAVKESEASPEPEEAELFTHVYRADTGVEMFGADRHASRLQRN
ncbi:pyruvate dehydrogenase E1 component alpha subunit [Klebsormidium nitens]|uniref:Pyruvate dehydrogenase E1 component subunit alpha n=1 Tax=Klebsormidium nitens TaxID=105231 RepID=A0A1Y1IT76_KLENI|nr:pyruvate dehydrogenase E1 component alpha subunit [Klebsormidium nitens]|eukprot:GAQ91857.1 pyruvate dehydrogenase E1 component alpha subunit [Klebsormidium nitens]